MENQYDLGPLAKKVSGIVDDIYMNVLIHRDVLFKASMRTHEDLGLDFKDPFEKNITYEDALKIREATKDYPFKPTYTAVEVFKAGPGKSKEDCGTLEEEKAKTKFLKTGREANLIITFLVEKFLGELMAYYETDERFDVDGFLEFVKDYDVPIAPLVLRASSTGECGTTFLDVLNELVKKDHYRKRDMDNVIVANIWNSFVTTMSNVMCSFMYTTGKTAFRPVAYSALSTLSSSLGLPATGIQLSLFIDAYLKDNAPTPKKKE